MGRVGAILGPILTGWLLSLQLPHFYNFLALSIPAVLGIITVFLINDKRMYNAEAEKELADKAQKDRLNQMSEPAIH